MTVTVSTEALQSSSRPARQKKASLQQLTVSLPTLSLAGYEVTLFLSLSLSFSLLSLCVCDSLGLTFSVCWL